MKVLKKKLLVTLIASLSLIPIGVSAAESLNLNSINSNYLQQVSVTYQGHTSTDWVGGLSGTLNGGLNQFFFCYDISHSINAPGSYLVNLFGPTASFPSYLNLSSTFNLQVASSLLANANIGSFSNVNQYSGLQLAVWSILYNWTSASQSTTLNGPNFSAAVSGDLLNQAQNFLAQAEALVNSGQYADTGNIQLLVNANNTPNSVSQTLAGAVEVPEPSTYLLLGSALMAAAVCAKRRNQLHA